MITYVQKNKPTEDDYGEVVRHFVVSDDHNGLLEGNSDFVDSSSMPGYNSGLYADGIAIEGLSIASECVVTITGHNFDDNDIIEITGTSDPSDWDDIKGCYEIVFIDVDSFKIRNVNKEVQIAFVGDSDEKIPDKIGGMIESELSFKINDALIRSKDQFNALKFIAAGLNSSKIRFCGLFINPGATRALANNKFIGAIQPEITDQDLAWRAARWGSDIKPLRERSFKAKPVYADFYDAIDLKDLILGNDDKNIPGIDDIWETENVFDGPGWFSRDVSGHNENVRVHALVSLNAVLRKLADNLEQALVNNNFGNYKIKFGRVMYLPGMFFPARWTHNSMVQGGMIRYPRYTTWSGATIKEDFATYAADGEMLMLDPDGNIPGFTGTGLDDLTTSGLFDGTSAKYFIVEIDSEGSPDTFKWSNDGGNTWIATGVPITGGTQPLEDGIYIKFGSTTGHTLGDSWGILPPLKSQTIWIDYKTVKEFGKGIAEIDEKQFRWTENKNLKSFVALIHAIALNFCVYAKFSYEDSTTLKVEFISRNSIGQTQVYIPGAEKASRKITGIIKEDETYNGVANPLAIAGADYYIKGGGYIYYESQSYLRYNKEESKRLLFTISPTIVRGYDACSDYHGVYCPYGHFPHNHYARRDTTRYDKNYMLVHEGLHTAIYMYVEKRSGQVHEADYYFTPCASLVLNIDGKGKEFTSLVDYVNFMANRDENYYRSEYNIDIPYLCGFSENSDGSNPDWKALALNKTVTLDGLDYIIKEIKISGKDLSTKIVCQAAQRFDTTDPINPVVSQPGIIPTPDPDRDIAGTELLAYNAVIINSTGEVEKADTIKSHQGKIYGIALEDAAVTGLTRVRTQDEIYNDDWSEILGVVPQKGDILRITTPDVSPVNITIDPINSDFSNKLYCKLGTFKDSNTLVIDAGFNEQYWFG